MLTTKFHTIVFLNLLMSLQFVISENNCEEKEKSLISLDVADYLITKAKQILPNCTGVATDGSDCGSKEKVEAHLDMVKKLISEAKENYPTCTEPNTKDPDVKEPVTEEPVTEKPKDCPKCRDCSEVLQYGQSVSGVYTIWPSSSLFPNKSLEVFCDMDKDGGGWTVIQRRGNYEPQENFYRDWNGYKNGFGNIKKDFWLGNDNIFILSNQGKYKIRFDLVSKDGEKAFAEYETFFIEDEASKYELHIGNYAGTAGDSMDYNNGKLFTTKDRDNGPGCAKRYKGGWWYDDCSYSNPNGEYNPGATGREYYYMTWWHWKSVFIGIAGSEIKIKAIVN